MWRSGMLIVVSIAVSFDYGRAQSCAHNQSVLKIVSELASAITSLHEPVLLLGRANLWLFLHVIPTYKGSFHLALLSTIFTLSF